MHNDSNLNPRLHADDENPRAQADFMFAGGGGDFGGIDFSKLGGGAAPGDDEEEEDDEDESDDDMPALEGEDDAKDGKKAAAAA